MKISESIGRFSIRKTLRFEMVPLGQTADFLEGHLAADEERAASLNKVKAAIEAEHLTMVRRVFKKLPDPIPSNYEEIRKAFLSDPEYATLSSRGAYDVMQSILQRCRANGWPVPKELADHDGWPTLTVKWHWHCFARYNPATADSPVRKWKGRTKADVERTCPLLKAPKRRKPNRNYWFDHSPFRVMFGNRSTGMSWCTDDWNLSRTFLLTDGDRVIVGIVPRESKFTPYALPDAANTELGYLLYEETAGLAPRMRAVPKELIDSPASRGAIYLFELAGRALRGHTNMSAIYLRALLSSANLADRTIHLNRGTEFFVRKGSDINREGKPDHFRQRFTEDKFYVSLRIVINSQLAGVKFRPIAFGDLSKFISENPTANYITVPAAPSPRGAGKSPSLLAGELAKQAVDEDAYVIFDPKTPNSTLSAVERKFNYIVIRGRDPLAAGGVLRGYQIPDRLFVGDLQEARERRRKMEELAGGSRPIALFDPVFSQGRYVFTFIYKTSDNVRHEDTCRADTRDEVFQKLRTVKIRPAKVWCDDPAYVNADIATRLKQLDALKSQGLITEAEHAEKRGKILAEL